MLGTDAIIGVHIAYYLTECTVIAAYTLTHMLLVIRRTLSTGLALDSGIKQSVTEIKVWTCMHGASTILIQRGAGENICAILSRWQID